MTPHPWLIIATITAVAWFAIPLAACKAWADAADEWEKAAEEWQR